MKLEESMTNLRLTLLLFSVIIIEGYVVLATELLAIREMVPFVGSGTDTVSIIIAAVLMPLAFGYYNGGHFRPFKRHGIYIGIRTKLILNILISMAILTVGLSYALMKVFFKTLIDTGITDHLLITAIFSVTFLVTPVYLLGQTIPLLSNYFNKESLSKITGRMLFFSTMGSFMGAVFSTLVLMSTVGVHNTVSFSIVLLAILVVMLAKKKTSKAALGACAMAIAAMLMNSHTVMRSFKIIDNNKYNTVMVYPDHLGNIHMTLNHMGSSMYNPQTGAKHDYIQFLEDQVIGQDTSDPKDILVIGAGAFTFGLEDTYNKYEYVDIDGSLKEIAEDHVLKQKLSENKKFTPIEARSFLMGTDKKYDVIILDAYLGGFTVPEHLVTQEFYKQVSDHLKDDGIVGINLIASASFSTPMSRHMDNTIRSVFPFISRHAVGGDYQLSIDDPNLLENVIYLYKRHPGEKPNEIYTDNRNRIFYDKPRQGGN